MKYYSKQNCCLANRERVLQTQPCENRCIKLLRIRLQKAEIESIERFQLNKNTVVLFIYSSFYSFFVIQSIIYFYSKEFHFNSNHKERKIIFLNLL